MPVAFDILSVPSRDRVRVLFTSTIEGRVSIPELRDVLPDVWTLCEFPTRQRSAWLTLFEIVGYVSDTEEALEGDLRVFRGWCRPPEARGMSWTLDIEKARWFAHRCAPLGGRARVYEATVQAADVLGYFTERGESEIVVSPRSLQSVRHVDPGEPPAMTPEERAALRLTLLVGMRDH